MFSAVMRKAVRKQWLPSSLVFRQVPWSEVRLKWARMNGIDTIERAAQKKRIREMQEPAVLTGGAACQYYYGTIFGAQDAG